MSFRRGVLSVVVLVVAACGGGDGTGMPEGEHVHSLGVTADGGLLLGLHGGLYASGDGVAWDLVGLSGEDAMVIAAGPTGAPVFVAGHNVLYRSEDGGEVFARLAPSDLPGLDIHGFAQAPSDGSVVYAYIVGYGLFASLDSGDTWEVRASIESMPRDVFGLAVVGNGDQKVVMVGPESGVLRSEDGGRSFERVFDLPSGAVTVESGAPDVVWAVTAGGLARSADTGRTWEILSTFDGVEGQPVALAAKRDEIWLVAEQPRALYWSGDVAVSWQRVSGP